MIKFVKKGEGKKIKIIDHVLVSKISCEDTNGAYASGEIIVPSGASPPLHSHEAVETFYVLEGEFTFESVEEGKLKETVAKSGDTFHVASNVPHTFRNSGKVEGKMLGLVQPGKMAEFFDKIGMPYNGEKLVAGKPNLWQIIKFGFLAKKYGIKFVKRPKKD